MLRKIVLLTLMMCLTAPIAHAQDPSPGTAGLDDPSFPMLGNGGYDVEHYTLDVEWDYLTGFIRGTAALDAVAVMDLSAFNLDLTGGMNVSSVTVNERDADFSQADPELTVTPAAYLPAGAAFTVVVVYNGLPEPVRGRGATATGWLGSPFGDVFVPPFGGPGWYPMNDHPSDKATYTVKITAPNALDVVVSGVLVEEAEQGVRKTSVWEVREPASGIALVISLFADNQIPGSGAPFYAYFPPSTSESGLAKMEDLAFKVDDMLAFYEERFGPYPFETYKAVVPQGLAGGAFSLHGVSVFARPSFTEQVVAQQLAQQWFGAAVTPENRADTWLAQGFATYAETLWTIHTTGEDPIGDFYDAVAVLDPPGSLPPDDIFNLSAYERGAWMLKALHLRLGDGVFFEIMRTYVARYRYDAVSAEDFIAVAEEISGEDLGDFFQGWLYDPVAPPVPELGLGGE